MTRIFEDNLLFKPRSFVVGNETDVNDARSDEVRNSSISGVSVNVRSVTIEANTYGFVCVDARKMTTTRKQIEFELTDGDKRPLRG